MKATPKFPQVPEGCDDKMVETKRAIQNRASPAATQHENNERIRRKKMKGKRKKAPLTFFCGLIRCQTGPTIKRKSGSCSAVFQVTPGNRETIKVVFIKWPRRSKFLRSPTCKKKWKLSSVKHGSSGHSALAGGGARPRSLSLIKMTIR